MQIPIKQLRRVTSKAPSVVSLESPIKYNSHKSDQLEGQTIGDLIASDTLLPEEDAQMEENGEAAPVERDLPIGRLGAGFAAGALRAELERRLLAVETLLLLAARLLREHPTARNKLQTSPLSTALRRRRNARRLVTLRVDYVGPQRRVQPSKHNQNDRNRDS